MPQGSLSRSRSTHKPKKPGFFLGIVGSNQISPETRFLKENAIRLHQKPKKPGFFFSAFRSNQISHRNPVSQRKRDRPETGFLLKGCWLKPDISRNPVSHRKRDTASNQRNRVSSSGLFAQTRYLTETRFLKQTRYGSPPGFFFSAVGPNQISHRNPVSQRKRDTAPPTNQRNRVSSSGLFAQTRYLTETRFLKENAIGQKPGFLGGILGQHQISLQTRFLGKFVITQFAL